MPEPDWKEVLAFAKHHWPEGSHGAPDYTTGWRSEEELLSMLPHFWSGHSWWAREVRPLYEKLKSTDVPAVSPEIR